MLQERSSGPRAHLRTLVTSLAVGVTVALLVLVGFAVRVVSQDNTTRATRTDTDTTVSTAPRAAIPPTGPAPTPGASPGGQLGGLPGGPPEQAGPLQPGEPVQGVQLWAKRPLTGVRQDQGSSIALPDGRTLWIFADTLQLGTEPTFFVTSSAGVTERDSWQLRYSRSKGGAPAEFLPRTAAERADAEEGVHYQAVWPTGSTLLPDGRILISYARYRVLMQEQDFEFLGAGLFEYRYRSLKALRNGGKAKRIAPDLWTPADGEVRSPVYADGYVYFHQCRDLRCQALRTTPAELTDRDSYRWWTGSDWTSTRSQARDIALGSSHPGGNASVVRLSWGGYAMADTEVGSVATEGLIWVAPNPWGPWSRAATFPFPRCPPPGCYGLNLHPAQSSIDRFRISYATHGVGPFVRVVDVPVWIGPDSSSILVR